MGVPKTKVRSVALAATLLWFLFSLNLFPAAVDRGRGDGAHRGGSEVRRSTYLCPDELPDWPRGEATNKFWLWWRQVRHRQVAHDPEG